MKHQLTNSEIAEVEREVYAKHGISLECPPEVSLFALAVILDGEIERNVTGDLARFEAAYKAMEFSDFCECYLKPALDQIFPK